MKGMTKVLVIICIVFLTIAVFGMTACVLAAEKEEVGDLVLPNWEPEFIKMECTAYCYGTTRSDNKPVRKGICAGATKYYGKTAAIYEDNNGKPGEFIGYYEVLDTGGDERIKNGQCLDIYDPDYNWCINFGRKKVLVVMLDGVG